MSISRSITGVPGHPQSTPHRGKRQDTRLTPITDDCLFMSVEKEARNRLEHCVFELKQENKFK